MMPAGMTSSLHFEAGGTIGSQVVTNDKWVSADIKDTESHKTLTVYVANNPLNIRKLARELELIVDRLLGIAEENEEQAIEQEIRPATDPELYEELRENYAVDMGVEF